MTNQTRHVITFALSLTILVFANSNSFTRDGLASTTTISDLAWMAGDWQTDSNGRMVSDEHWVRPVGGVMIGMSRTVADEKLISFESLRVEQRGDAIVCGQRERWLSRNELQAHAPQRSGSNL